MSKIIFQGVRIVFNSWIFFKNIATLNNGFHERLKQYGLMPINQHIYKNRDLMWENMGFYQVTHSLKLSHLGFHLIKVCIYVKFLVH